MQYVRAFPKPTEMRTEKISAKKTSDCAHAIAIVPEILNIY